VWELSQHSGTELLMLLAIADFADDAGNAYPSVATLAGKCRMKPRNANYMLKALQESGELRVTMNGGPRGANRYRVMFDALGVQSSAGVQAPAGVQSSAATPALDCAKPLQRIADKPSLNRQEPSERQRSAPKRRIPKDWTPDADLLGWARKERPDLDLQAVIENFRDYHLGQGKARADWPASFRYWIRNEGRMGSSRTTKGNRRAGVRHNGFDQPDYYNDTAQTNEEGRRP
jgi:hypothetical protein